MSLTLILAIAALGCGVLLVVQNQARVFAVIAAVVAAVEVLLALNILRLSISGVPLGLVLGAGLAVAGALCWTKVQAKLYVSAATLILLVGAMQVFTSLKR